MQLRVRLIGILSVASAAACTETHIPTEFQTGLTLARSQLSQDSGTWDTYSADVVITDETGETASRSPIGPIRLSYHEDRFLRADGTWATKLSFAPVAVPAWSSAPPPAADIARLETNDASNSVVLFDRSGKQINLTVPTRRLFPSTSHADPRLPTLPDLDKLKKIGRTFGPTTRSPEAQRDWASRILINPRSRGLLQAALVRSFGQPSEKGAQQRFVRSDNQNVHEILVDKTIGAISEENDVIAGKLVRHTTSYYDRLPNGDYVRKLVRIQEATSAPRTKPIERTIALSNVTFSHSGATQ